MRNRGEHPCPPYLEDNVLDDGCCLLGREFEGDGKARSFSRIPKCLLVAPLINLDDDAIRPIVFLPTLFFPRFPIANSLLDISCDRVMRIHFEAELPQV